MATLQIPTRTDVTRYRQIVDLEGTSFVFDFNFNSREGFWYFDLLDINEDPIKVGIKVVVGFPLLRLVRDARRPLGEVTAIDTTNSGKEAGQTDLGEEVVLLYTESTDIEAL